MTDTAADVAKMIFEEIAATASQASQFDGGGSRNSAKGTSMLISDEFISSHLRKALVFHGRSESSDLVYLFERPEAQKMYSMVSRRHAGRF